jgi:hypothetical protein
MYNNCIICLTSFQSSWHLNRHKARKIPCKQTQIQIIPKTIPKIIPNNPKQSQIIPNNPKSHNSVSKSNFKCKYCKKVYKSSNGLYKHINEIRCKELPTKVLKMLILNKKNKIIKKKIENNKQLLTLAQNNSNNLNTSTTNNFNNFNNSNNINNINNNNNNTLNNNITNNVTIKINPFGEENTDFLTKKEKIKLINKCYMGVPSLIKTIHNRPENRNFYIPNMNKNILAYINDKNEIEYNDYNTICDKLIQKNIDRIDEYFCEFQKELKDNIQKRMIKVIEENNNNNLATKYMDDIKYYLMTISKNNKKDINKFIDNIEMEIKISN